jgi:outer membrane lipopolysaccharide assembly protein LptE/RlpB
MASAMVGMMVKIRCAAKRLMALLAILGVALGLSGCGYRFVDKSAGPRANVHRVAIPLFENGAFIPELEGIFANAMRRQFMLRGPAQVVSTEQADAIFRGKILSVETSTITQRLLNEDVQSSVAAETQITVVVDVQCVTPEDGRVIWQVKNFSFSSNYLHISTDSILTFDNQRYALENIAQEVAVCLYDNFYNSF